MVLLPFALSLISQSSPIEVSGPRPASVGTYGIAEFSIGTRGSYRNPFDPDEVAISGVFTAHDGTRVTLPAFWDGAGFRLRFCPTESGSWALQVRIEAGGTATESRVHRFLVAPSSNPGFVRTAANGRYLRFDDGKSFVPIGLNLCWPDKSGLASYERRFSRLHSVGGNFARIWTTQERRLETEKVGLGKYDVQAASFYDSVFRLAGEYGIRTMLTFDDYRVLAKTDYFNAHWDTSPYNSANGGPLTEPTGFFMDPLCRKLYKQRLRYLVARYSAFSSLAFWELYNEQDNIPDPGVPTEWFREMTNYLASIDPYHHIITTSYSWRDKPEVWESPALGLTQGHLYGQGDTVDFVSMIEGHARKLDRFDKPRLIGEFGITWKEPDIALDKAGKGTPLHDALWASIMTGDCGGALTWWWDNYLEPLNLWPVFEGISRFVAGIDFAHRNFRPMTLQLQGLTALGMRDEATGEAIAWLHDPASNWKNDAAGIEPPVWSGRTLTVPESREMTVEVWDTRTGLILRREELRPSDGQLGIVLPDFRRDIAVHLFRRA